MHVESIRLVDFRSYADAAFGFGPGLNVIVGANASGKTNLVEAAYWCLTGVSPRTAREDRLVARGAAFARVVLDLSEGHRVEAAYASGQGKRIKIDGREAASLSELRRFASAFVFVPESLLLVKGGPARRRHHIDAFGSGLDVAYQAAAATFQAAVRQRNAQLAMVRGGADERGLDPWDTQFVAAALELCRRRREVVSLLALPFARYAAALSPAAGTYSLCLRSALGELEGDEQAYSAAIRQRRANEIRSGVSALGPHRDDVELYESTDSGARRDLRAYGSQGEQRAAVLALLLAEHEVAATRTGATGMLFLDDVMSELDHGRRRLLVEALGDAGQAIVTATTTMYFTPDELARANVIRLGGYPVAGPGAAGEDAVGAARPGSRREGALDGRPLDMTTQPRGSGSAEP